MVEVRIGDIEQALSWEEWEQRVRTGRIPPDARVRIDAVTGGAFVRAGDLEMYQSLRDDHALKWRSRFLSSAPPILTALLVGVQVRIWWWARLPEVRERVLTDGLNHAPPVFEDGEVWRLLSMGVLHVDWDHLLLNMLWLAYTGAALERSLGRANLFVLYVASVLGGSVLSLLGSPETPSLGASGGVFGLIAAVVVFGFTRPELLPKRGRRLFGLAMLPYLVVMFGMGLLSDTTDNWSHFGGLLTGGALAFALDPPDLERRRGWTRAWQIGTLAAVAGGMAAIRATGPWLVAIDDVEVVRTLHTRRGPGAPPTPTGYREVAWAVPVAWRSGVGSAGIVGYRSTSPRARSRAFAVRARTHDAPMTRDALLDAFVADLERAFDEIEVGPPVPAMLGDTPAEQVLLRVGASRHAVWWTAAIRGTQTLEAVFEAEADRMARLAPLHERLLARVVWNEPLALIDARATVARNPASRRGRVDLAEGLAVVGDVSQAVRLYAEVVEEAPHYEPGWIGLVRLLGTFPDATDDPDAWLQRALDALPTPEMVIEVATALERQGRTRTAIGLLEVAWARHPGDRRLRRARRARDLPTGLHPERLVPGHHPLEGPPPPLTLTAAAAAGEAWLAEEAARVDAAVAVLADPDAGADALVRLAVGFVPDAPTERDLAAAEAIVRQIERDASPRWATDAFVAAVLDSDVGATLAARRQALQGDPP